MSTSATGTPDTQSVRLRSERRDLTDAPDGCRYFRSESGEWWVVSPDYGHHELAGWIWWHHGVDPDAVRADHAATA